MPSVEAFGMELRRRRLHSGLSLRALARIVHFDPSHLSRVENGERHAGAELARLCDAALGAGGALEMLADDSGLLGGAEPEYQHPFGTAQFDAAAQYRIDGEVRWEALRALFRRMREAGRQIAPAMVIPAIAAQARTVSSLAAVAGPADRHEALRLAAHHAEYIGWMLQEQGDVAGALEWTARAVELDARGGGLDMAAYALVRRAELALYQARPDRALALVAQARETGGASRRIHAMAAQREAQAFALAGDRAGCEAALARSEECWASGTGRQDRLDLFGSSSIGDPNAMAAAWCELDLGRPDDAAEQTVAVLATVPDASHRIRALLSARLAVALALAGALQSSCDLAEQVIPDSRSLQSATTMHQLARLSGVLGRWPRNRRAQQVRADLHWLLHPRR
ncbi:helix-turn-helix transcriptional regulator [Dactylosporangium salmoneum]|uniref:Helix-turn-helix transcriptional regulator n=1 Tax=Dactylosporangium salmoneum TaxID=53361 RepID=A0ABN3I1Z4_9ACTN